MRAQAVQIEWHRVQTVTSADFDPRQPDRFATSGGDSYARIWQVEQDEASGESKVSFCSTLVGHGSGINVVRWSPVEGLIATGDNTGNIALWRLLSAPDALSRSAPDEDPDTYREHWRQVSLLHGHQDEVSDLAWSPCGQYIASVGTDLKLRIWDYAKRETIGTAQDHTEFIQGVSWDPLGQYIATESVDRSLCVYSLAINTVDKSRRIASLKCVNKSYRMEQQQQQQQQQQGGGDESEPPQKMSRLSSSSAFGTRYMRLYCEPLTMSFFRRCSFSPDGSLLVAPAGQYRRFDPSTASTGADEGLSDSGVAEVLAPTTWMYTRNQINGKPVLHLPGRRGTSWVVRFSPVLYKLRDGEASVFQLPYRMVFAVGTDDNLVLYDTQHTYPIAFVSGLHVYRYQDLAWSCDGRTLVAPSHDGYCTVVSFDEHELGEPLPFEQYPNAVQEARQKQMSSLRAHDAAPIITAPEASTPSVPVSEVAAPPPTAATAAKKRIVPTFVSALQ